MLGRCLAKHECYLLASGRRVRIEKLLPNETVMCKYINEDGSKVETLAMASVTFVSQWLIRNGQIINLLGQKT